MTALGNTNRPFAGLFALLLIATTPIISSAQTQPPGQLSRKVVEDKAILPTSKAKAAALSPLPIAPQAPKVKTCPAIPTPAPVAPAFLTSAAVAKVESDSNVATKVAAIAAVYVNEATSKRDSEAVATPLAVDLPTWDAAIASASGYAEIASNWADVASDCSKAASASGASAPVVWNASTNAATAAANATAAYQYVVNALHPVLDVSNQRCQLNGVDNNNNPTYSFKSAFPLVGKGCKADEVKYYYQVPNSFTLVNQAKYLYNPTLSTNQVNADLLTTTFYPGFQIVLAATATAGTSQAASTSSTTTTPSSFRSHDDTSTTTTNPAATDSVATTISKLESGGDFNLRAQYPLANFASAGGTISGFVNFIPNVGFMVNGLSGQNTITNVTNYAFNLPLEAYVEFASIPGIANQTSAVLYGDVRYGGEFISDAMKQATGLGSIFGIGAAAFGIEFANSIRLGGQYYFGPNAAYCTPTAAGACTPETTAIKGFRLAVAFSPTKSK
jgi:hypothetical protein